MVCLPSDLLAGQHAHEAAAARATAVAAGVVAIAPNRGSCHSHAYCIQGNSY